MKKLLQRSIAMAWGLLIAGYVSAQNAPQPRLATIDLTAGMYVIQAEVAQTHREQSIGLMHRQKMADNEGMLFVYENAQIRWLQSSHALTW